MGMPSPGYDIDLLDDEGRSCEVGEKGQIVVRTDARMPVGMFDGYYRDPDLTARAWHDGIYHTGDVAWKDEDGYFWFVGRTDDVIKSSGYRIGPFEVESALIEHPAVLECAVTGVPDADRGAGGEGHRRAGQGVRGEPRAGHRAAGAREEDHRALQVPAHHRVRRRAAQDDQRQDPPGGDQGEGRGGGQLAGVSGRPRTSAAAARVARPRRQRKARAALAMASSATPMSAITASHIVAIPNAPSAEEQPLHPEREDDVLHDDGARAPCPG